MMLRFAKKQKQIDQFYRVFRVKAQICMIDIISRKAIVFRPSKILRSKLNLDKNEEDKVE